jgi:16S rRNA (guanine527-N7)-methyltransferase
VTHGDLAGGWQALGARYGLEPRAVEQLQRVVDHMARDETAPTSVREPAAALDVHVADSLVALDLDFVRAAGRIADLGPGAGFPGLALAAALPGARVALVESASRKCEYLRRVVEAAGVENAEVVHARAEEWTAGIEGQDLVVARALAALPVIAEYAAPLLRVGGCAVAWKGRRDGGEEERGARAAEQLGLAVRGVVPVSPFAAAEHRHLHVYEKVEPTPERFPRRPGRAATRPLG